MLSAGPWHTCAILATSELKCWGNGYYGALGPEATDVGWDVGPYVGDRNGEMGDNLPIVELGFGVLVTSVATGWYHTCARP